MNNARNYTICIAGLLTGIFTIPALAEDAAELAKKLQNPIASLISVPLKLNWDTGIGPENADTYVLNIQPVVPISISEDTNLIIRTIIPIIKAEGAAPGLDNESGLGDILQSFFFSPKAPSKGGWIWGAGPALLYPSASNDAVGGEKWGMGPTAVVLKQDSGWTYGALGNHVWSIAGNDHRNDISATFIQPFLSYTTKTFTTYGINTESTYDWKNRQWTVPINLSISQLMKFGNQPVSFQAGVRSYLERPENGPNWGLSFTTTFLFPK